MSRKLIREVTTGEVKVAGFVEKIRVLRWMIFIILRDGSGSIQLTVEKEKWSADEIEKLSMLTVGSTLSAYGMANNNDAVKNGGREIVVSKIEIESIAKPYPVGPTSLKEQKSNWRFICLRDEREQVLFKAESVIQGAFMEFMQSNGYTIFNTPKLLSTPSESGAELFEVGYFDRKAYLAQSCQFYKQMALQAGFEKFGEIGPAFRADKSNTNRHQTEFVVVDAEIAWPESLETIMDEQENMIKFVFSKVLGNKELCEKIEKYLGVKMVEPSFYRMTFEEAKQMMEGLNIKSEAKDFSPEEEKMICKMCADKYGCEFVFVTKYPIATRPFYHKWNNEGNYTESYDLLYNGREITTGAIREHRSEVLTEQIRFKAKELKNPNLEESLKDYVQFFEYGAVPHGGFGMGFARFIQSMFKLNNIDEAVLLSRTPTRLTP